VALLALASCPLAGVLPAQENPTARPEKLEQELKAHKEAAYERLQRALDAGYAQSQDLNKDDDFKAIRQEARFRGMV
jgi:hypothetical protein